MNRYRQCLPLVVIAGLMALCGAGCPQFVQQPPPLPHVLPPSPSLPQVIEAVHRNNGQIQSSTTNQAMLSGPGWPTLRANLAFQRPGRLRIRAETGLTGAEIDLGSNEDLFWFWMRRISACSPSAFCLVPSCLMRFGIPRCATGAPAR